MPYDPFSFPDPFADAFGGPRGGGRRRQAAYPPLPEAEAQSAISQITDAGLSGLGYVGSTLDKFFGGRAVRGALGGNAREVLSAIPGSDWAGLTDPSQAVSGDDLLRNVGYDPSKGNWLERNLVGPAVEIGLDPSTYLGGIGALNKFGKLAKAEGRLTKGFLPAVAKGERSLMYGLTGQGVADAAEGALKLAGQGNDLLRKLPYVAPVEDAIGAVGKKANLVRRSLFDPDAGHVVNETVQDAFGNVKVPNQRAAEVAAETAAFDLDQRRLGVYASGAIPEQADRYLRQKVENVVPSVFGPSPLSDDAIRGLDEIAAGSIELGRDAPMAADRARGIMTPELMDEQIDYMMRQSSKAGGSGRKAREKLLPATHPNMLRRKEAFRDRVGGTIQLDDYRTPDIAGAKRTMKGPEVSKYLLEDNLTRQGAGPGGIPLSPEATAKETKQAKLLGGVLKRLPEEYIDRPGKKGRTIFGTDVVGDAKLRALRSARATSSADAVYDVIGKGNKLAKGLETDVPVPKVLADAGLKGEAAQRLAAEKLGVDADALIDDAVYAAEPGTIPVAEDVLKDALSGFKLPAPEARGATKLLNRWQVPEEWAPVLGKLDSWQDRFRNMTYSVWPSSHVRNYAPSGLFENMASGDLLPGKPFSGLFPGDPAYGMSNAIRAGKGVDLGIADFRGLTPDEQRIALFREMVPLGVTGKWQGNAAEQIGRAPELGVGGPTAPRTSMVGILKEGFKDKAPVETGKRVGQAVEENLRIPLYIKKRQQGFTKEAAKQAVDDAHFDYTRGTDFEKSVMKRIVPFYNFSRHNIPKQINRAITDPAKTMTPLRLAGTLQDDEGYVPQYLRSGLATPIGGPEDGTQRYLSGLGLPFEEALSRLKVGDGIQETGWKTLEGLLGALRPELKLPLENATGRQFFTGRDLADLKPGKTSTLGIFDDETARPLAQIIANTPASRFVSTLDRMLDERKGLPTKALSLLSGTKLTDVETEKWRAIDARHANEKALRDAEGVKEMSSFYQGYADDGSRLPVSPAEAKRLQLEAYLTAKAREAAEEKRRIGVRTGP